MPLVMPLDGEGLLNFVAAHLAKLGEGEAGVGAVLAASFIRSRRKQRDLIFMASFSCLPPLLGSLLVPPLRLRPLKLLPLEDEDGALVGRAPLWGLGAFGPQGVQRVLEILQAELAGAMAHCGCPSVTAADPSMVKTDFP